MIYTIILLVIADLFLLLAWRPNIFQGYIIYPLVLNFDNLRFQLACLVIPISIAGIFVAASLLKAQSILHSIIVITLLATNVIAYCARFTGLALKDKERASIQFENHIYHVIGTEQYFGPSDASWVNLIRM